mmetsp:Transcript_39191/g.59788  ORF Transcript_39191/g.59788 Transcript_39191/m.59788 type:complete len:154 (+) Transcript_39191:771-1232(+)
MRRYSNYEYKLRQKSMLNHNVLLVLLYIIKAMIFIVDNYCVITESADPSNTDSSPHFHEEVKQCLSYWSLFLVYEGITPFYLFNIPYQLLAFTVTKVKHISDPLEGVSKLDSLLLVSIFQRSNFKDNHSGSLVDSGSYEDSINRRITTMNIVK